ncbi:mucin-2, partial [Exaiptasia diaphana]|uniref:Thyroglobulin type-1 domain-containing protein n=1 Tax=Exaiptasia diaphana TaxID=2652724 RepID=A0A913XAV3_EXADI
MDIFIPECKPNGQYNEVQCYTFPVTGKTQCWCVDVDSGVEQAGTRLDERQPNCLQSTTTSAPVTTPAVPPALIVCVVTVYRCCPDGVTAAKGPNNQGCPVLTTPPPVPLETSPTVPPGSANEVCVTIRFKQVWYQQLLNHAGSYYLELQKNLEKSVKQIYKIHPDFVNVHFSDARPEPNPMHPSGAKALAVFFVLSFRRLVADPLATLRDSIDEKPNLAERSVFPMTLRNLGKPSNLKCPQENYKPFNPHVKKPTPVTPGTKTTSKPAVTTALPTVNPCGSCTTPETCPTQCPPPQPTTTPTNPPTTPPVTPPSTPPVTPPKLIQPTLPPQPNQTTTPKVPPQVTTQPAPACGPCPSPAACPPQCPVTPPQSTTPPPLPPQTGAPSTLPTGTTAGPPLPMQTTVPPPLPQQQTTTPPCVPWPCHIPPCAPPCQTTTASPTTPTTAKTTPTTPQTSPTTPVTNATTPSIPPSTQPPLPTTPAPTKTPPINGGYTNWTEWTECSATCDGGVQQRTRACTNPPPQHGGKVCEGSSFETKPCNT